MEKIGYVADAGVATITIHREEALGALDREAKSDLLAAMRRAAKEDNVRAVVLTGGDGYFSSGEDIKGYVGEGGGSIAASLRHGFHEIVLAMTTLPKPIVAAVTGVAAGAGFSIALAADLRIAGRSATLMAAFSKVGLVPDSGLSYFLPRYVGLGRALEIAYRAEPLPADEALSLGLFNRVVDDERVVEEALVLARELADGPTLALARTKKAMIRGYDLTFSELLDYEADLQELCARSSDHSEGVAAFIGKRPPHFQGL